MTNNPLRLCEPSPFSRIAAQFGKGDTASAAGRPLRGGRWLGPRPAQAEQVLRAAGVDPSARGEQLSVQDFVAIADARAARDGTP